MQGLMPSTASGSLVQRHLAGRRCDLDGITKVRGVLVGHAQDEDALTGCTVVLTPNGAVAGVDVRGSAPGTRETDLMRPCNLVERIQAVVLSGGSAYGLDAASGAMEFLEEQGVGFETPFGVVPIVGAAVIFDLGIGNPKVRPDRSMGYRACQAASSGACAEGNVGAGTGATVGKMLGAEYAMKGGIGTCVAELPRSGRGGSVHVGAIVSVNALGDIVDPWTGTVVAGAYDREAKRFIGPGTARKAGMARRRKIGESVARVSEDVAGTNTTVAVVATDAMLDKEGANKVAQMAHDGLAGAIVPAHTMYDGDTVFCLSTGKRPLSRDRAADITAIGSLAAEVLAAAVVRAVRVCRSAGGYLAACDVPEAASDRK
jgi:L-aminopeptidase/D-esterase-like protein